jgi:hypothetical protein
MNKTSTNNENNQCSDESLIEAVECVEDLDGNCLKFYTLISTHLNSIQIHPKDDIVLKIITYSKNKGKSSE